MLKLENIFTAYGSIEALNNINLEIKEGEIVSLIGANGAGKSTLLMTISGVKKPTKGSIYFNNQEISRLEVWDIVNRGIIQSPEGRRIFPRMTVLENLYIGATNTNAKYFKQDIERILAIFPRLRERLDQRGGTLSGGEQQMLAIARSLMARPKLLLLDEPSLGLAPLIVRQIFEIIKSINKEQGITVFLVEQNAHHALKIANRGLVMANGKIVLEGTGTELLSSSQVKEAYLGG